MVVAESSEIPFSIPLWLRAARAVQPGRDPRWMITWPGADGIQ
jgi:hypothetical protein